MSDFPTVTGIRFVPARDRADGLLAYASFKYGVLILDGVTVRRALDGHLHLSFPENRDGSGRPWPYVRPFDQAARDAITDQVITALKRQGVIQ